MVENGRVNWYEGASLSVVRYVGKDVDDVDGPGPPRGLRSGERTGVTLREGPGRN